MSEVQPTAASAYYLYFFRPEVGETKDSAHFFFRVEGQSLAMRILDVLRRSDDAEFGLWPVNAFKRAERDTVETRLADLRAQSERADLPPQKPLRAKRVKCFTIARQAARAIADGGATATQGNGGKQSALIVEVLAPELSQLACDGSTSGSAGPVKPASASPSESLPDLGSTEKPLSPSSLQATPPEQDDELSKAEFARFVGIHPATAGRWRQDGMRLTLSEAKRQREARDRRRRTKEESDAQADRERDPGKAAIRVPARILMWECPKGHHFDDEKCPQCGAPITDCKPALSRRHTK